jgi:purine nucleosidase
MHQYLIDTDPGVDDALALLMLFAQPDAKVLGLCIGAGNVGLNYTVANALKLLDVVGCDVPVFPGCATPLVQMAEDAAFVHGRDGFGDTGYVASSRCAQQEHAAQAILRITREHPKAVTLVALGPLTNIALALRLDPTLPQRVQRLVVMGGAVTGRGNISRIPAEFNVAFDPEAAHIVFSSWPCFDLVDWEATLAHGFDFDVFQNWLKMGTARAQFYAAISRKTQSFMKNTAHRGRWHAADALAMAAALEPDQAQWDSRYVAVELNGALTRGATIVDWDERGLFPSNARLLRQFNKARFEQLLAGCFKD